MVSAPNLVAEKDDEMIDYLVLLIALWALAGVIYLGFNQRIFIEWLGVGSNKKVIANVTYLKQDVRYRVAEDFIWISSEHRQDVHNNDSIFTGDDSSTEITFKDKSKMTVGPNSLVKLTVNAQGTPVLSVGRGSIAVRVAKGKTIKVVANEEVQEIVGTGDIVQVAAAPEKDMYAAATEAPSMTSEASRFIARAAPDSKPEIIAPDNFEIFKPIEKKLRPFELSVGATMLSSTGRTALSGEAALQMWLSEFSRAPAQNFVERIGIAAKHSRSGGAIDLNQSNADLKFKIQQGQWNHEKAMGVMLSYQRISYLGYYSNQLGAGLFLGKSFGGRYSSSFGLSSLWSSPKWLEADLQYYPYSPGGSLGVSFNTSATGKVFVSNSFYIYTKLGYYQNDFTDTRQGVQVKTLSGYGLCGAGASF